MEPFAALILLSLFSCGAADKASRSALRTRSLPKRQRDVQPMYSRHYADEYEPVSYAAIPLHGPLPVLHVISPAPVHPYRPLRLQTARPARQPLPDRDLDGYASHQQEVYEPYPYASAYGTVNNVYNQYPHEYVPPRPPQKYHATDYDDEYSSPSLVVYARPNKQGGFTYRNKPSPTTNKGLHNPRSKRDPEPVILRIHKHKIVQD